MNKLLLYSFFLSFLVQVAEISSKDNFLVSQKLDSTHTSNNKGFEALKDNEYLKIYDYDVNHVLHILNHDNKAKDHEVYDRTHIPRSSNTEHTLKLKGNAIGVTGFWVSKLAVHAIAQIAYALIAGATSLVYPPAAPVVYCSLQFTFAALVEIASNMVAYGITFALGARALV